MVSELHPSSTDFFPGALTLRRPPPPPPPLPSLPPPSFLCQMIRIDLTAHYNPRSSNNKWRGRRKVKTPSKKNNQSPHPVQVEAAIFAAVSGSPASASSVVQKGVCVARALLGLPLSSGACCMSSFSILSEAQRAQATAFNTPSLSFRFHAVSPDP